MAIVITFLFGAPLLIAIFPDALNLSRLHFVVLWLVVLMIALVGFIDDHISLKASTRLLVQSLAAVGVVWAVGGLPVLSIFGISVELAWFGFLLAWVGVIWVINLYNFMDGIDGLAAGEAVSVCLVMALIHYFDGGQWSKTELILLLGTATAGFLCWNFPPARIFMGDGGSGFLGVMLASLMLLDAHLNQAYLWAWLVMLGVFVVDATWTLFNRYRLRCRLSYAHRTHGYQYATRCYGSHKTVTLTVILINCLWLAPISIMIVGGYVDGLFGLCIAYLPLAFLAYYFNAGVPE